MHRKQATRPRLGAPTRTAAWMLVLVALSVAMAGCAAHEEGGKPKGPTSTEVLDTTTTTTATTTTTTTTTAAPVGTAPIPPRVPDGAFVSPSRNIFCLMDDNSVLCASEESEIQVPEEERQRCATDIGDAIVLNRGKPAVLLCHGDPAYLATGQLGDVAPTLEYGASITFGPITCRSMTTGVRCSDPTTGHGFRLARASYELK